MPKACLTIGQYKMQTADCRPGTKCRYRLQTTITLRVTDIMTEVVQKVRRSKTASTNMADKINQTNSSKPTTISE